MLSTWTRLQSLYQAVSYLRRWSGPCSWAGWCNRGWRRSAALGHSTRRWATPPATSDPPPPRPAPPLPPPRCHRRRTASSLTWARSETWPPLRGRINTDRQYCQTVSAGAFMDSWSNNRNQPQNKEFFYYQKNHLFYLISCVSAELCVSVITLTQILSEVQTDLCRKPSS